MIIFAGNILRANWPPFISERCFRTQLSSLIVDPVFSNFSISHDFSFSAMPLAGFTKRDEAPPERRKITRSFLVHFSARLTI